MMADYQQHPDVEELQKQSIRDRLSTLGAVSELKTSKKTTVERSEDDEQLDTSIQDSQYILKADQQAQEDDKTYEIDEVESNKKALRESAEEAIALADQIETSSIEELESLAEDYGIDYATMQADDWMALSTLIRSTADYRDIDGSLTPGAMTVIAQTDEVRDAYKQLFGEESVAELSQYITEDPEIETDMLSKIRERIGENRYTALISEHLPDPQRTATNVPEAAKDYAHFTRGQAIRTHVPNYIDGSIEYNRAVVMDQAIIGQAKEQLQSNPNDRQALEAIQQAEARIQTEKAKAELRPIEYNNLIAQWNSLSPDRRARAQIRMAEGRLSRKPTDYLGAMQVEQPGDTPKVKRRDRAINILTQMNDMSARQFGYPFYEDFISDASKLEATNLKELNMLAQKYHETNPIPALAPTSPETFIQRFELSGHVGGDVPTKEELDKSAAITNKFLEEEKEREYKLKFGSSPEPIMHPIEGGIITDLPDLSQVPEYIDDSIQRSSESKDSYERAVDALSKLKEDPSDTEAAQDYAIMMDMLQQDRAAAALRPAQYQQLLEEWHNISPRHQQWVEQAGYRGSRTTTLDKLRDTAANSLGYEDYVQYLASEPAENVIKTVHTDGQSILTEQAIEELNNKDLDSQAEDSLYEAIEQQGIADTHNLINEHNDITADSINRALEDINETESFNETYKHINSFIDNKFSESSMPTRNVGSNQIDNVQDKIYQGYTIAEISRLTNIPDNDVTFIAKALSSEDVSIKDQIVTNYIKSYEKHSKRMKESKADFTPFIKPISTAAQDIVKAPKGTFQTSIEYPTRTDTNITPRKTRRQIPFSHRKPKAM